MVKVFSIVFNAYPNVDDFGVVRGCVAECWSLPGVASYGDTEQEAIDNAWEALAGRVLEYRRLGKPIPWATEIIGGSC